MKIEILNVAEGELHFQENAVPEKKSTIGIELRPVFMYRETTDVVGVQVSLRFVNQVAEQEIMKYGLLATFRIDKTEMFANGKSKADLVQNSVMLKLLEVSVGMLRGTLAIRTKGTKMEDVILPYFEIDGFAKTLIVDKVDA